MKKTSQIDRIPDLSIANYRDTFVLVDSDELGLTGKMRLSEILKFLGGSYNLRTLKFANGNLVKFENGNLARVAG